MKYRILGRTDYEVSEIGFGAWGIGKQMWKGAQDSDSLKALHAAADQGVNFVDTALAYGNGHSEKLVGQLARERDERIYIATKIPPRNLIWPARGPLDEVFPSDYIRDCTEQSLRNLGVERIDLIQLHVWSPDWLTNENWYKTFLRLREEGKIAFFGVSVNDHEPESVIELVRSGKVDTIQVIYNIFDQSPEDVLFPACRESNVGVIARVPFDEGSLTGKITPETTFPPRDWRNLYFKGNRKHQVYERVEELKVLLDGSVDTLPELALRFCLSSRDVSSVIPGMRSVSHVKENTSVSDKGGLPEPSLKELRDHRWIRNFYPQP